VANICWGGFEILLAHERADQAGKKGPHLARGKRKRSYAVKGKSVLIRRGIKKME